MHILLRCFYPSLLICSFFLAIKYLTDITHRLWDEASFCMSAETFCCSLKTWQSLDEKQTANISSGTGNKSLLRCYDMNDNSASGCLLCHMGFVSTLRVQPGLARDRESRIHFHKSFLDTTSRLCGWQSVACKLPLHWQCKGAPLGLKYFSGYLWLENKDDLFPNCDNNAFNININ